MPHSTNNYPVSSNFLPYGFELDANGSTLIAPKEIFTRRVQLLLAAAGDHSLDCLSVLGDRLEKHSDGLRFLIRAGRFASIVNLGLYDTSGRSAQEAYCRLAQHEALIVPAVSHDITWGSSRFGQTQLPLANRFPRVSITIKYAREMHMLTAAEFENAAQTVAKAYNQLRTAVLPYV